MNVGKDLTLRLDAIIETAIDGIITIDNKGRMLSTNLAVEHLFQYTKEEMIGHNVSMLMPEPYHSNHDQYLDNYTKTRKAKIIGIGREVRGRRKDRSIFPFRLAVSEVILSDRIIFTGIIHDLSDTKKAQKQLQQLNDKLEDTIAERTNQLESAINRLIKTNRKLENSEEAMNQALSAEKQTNELKSRFITTASHEFRTPLSTILSSAALISKYTTEEQQTQRNRHIDKIKNSVNHLTGILNDFLDLSKLEEGKITLQNEQIEIKKLIKEAISDLKGVVKADQELILDCKADIEVFSDHRTIKNILFNLLSNAIKYSDSGIIKISVLDKREEITFEITDKGKGIPESEQKYLFERFFRASNVENIQGTGLGLSIVQRYIDLLGGSISFESKENFGTTFTVGIPKSPN